MNRMVCVRRKVGIGAFVSAALFAAVLIIGCDGKKVSAHALPDGALDKSGQSRTAVPAVPAAPIVPAADFVIEYRHTGFSYAEVFGFDTYAYRFASLPDGSLESAVLFGRMADGEAEISRFSFVRAGNEIQILESPKPKNPNDGAIPTRVRATLVPSPQGEAVRGIFEGVVEKTAEGFLSFRTPGGEAREEYRLGTGAEVGVSRRVLGGAVVAEGGYLREGRGALVYRERKVGDRQGAEDVSVTFEEDVRNLLSFRTEGVVPINEVRISSGNGCLGGNLLNLAIVDSVLGPDRRIRPALSYLYLR